jgi:hypothetical protein
MSEGTVWVRWYFTRKGWQHGQTAKEPSSITEEKPKGTLFTVLTPHEGGADFVPPPITVKIKLGKRIPRKERENAEDS